MLVVHRIALMFLSMADRFNVDGMRDGMKDAQEARIHHCRYFFRSNVPSGRIHLMT